jgi:hypothetical protein
VKAKFGVILVLMILSVLGCREPATNTVPPSPKINSPSNYSRIFTYSGKGFRPSFTNDTSKKIKFVDVGQLTMTAHGEDGLGGGGTNQFYRGGRIGFADGSIQSFSKITTGTSMNGSFSWVRVEK